MKILMGLLFTILLGAGYFYFQSGSEPSASFLQNQSVQMPPHFFVTNGAGEQVGFGMPLFSEGAVLFDGFLEEEIFKKDLKIEFSLRDFETKVGYMQIPYWNGDLPKWSETAPIVGNTLYWLSGMSGDISSGKVLSVESDPQQSLPIILTGGVDLQSLGSPVFNAQGHVYGIITGADTASQQVFMTRIDRILKYYEGVLGEE